MIRRPPRSTLSSSSAASDVYKRQGINAEYGEARNFGNATASGVMLLKRTIMALTVSAVLFIGYSWIKTLHIPHPPSASETHSLLAQLRRAESASLSEQRSCVGWRQTAGCNPAGRREHGWDLGCSEMVLSGKSGYCECGGGVKLQEVSCEHAPFRCQEVCSPREALKRQLVLEEAKLEVLMRERETLMAAATVESKLK
eukprot:TRINITY_DN11163_c0_g1_i1.p1 TRINITY_DN11163_c0_g1~~TRINITY_DN11163_c0_g1_i1.p1  ORF type:complete len:199 (+),score=52.86 TRINITY_DN11163_c0_g1_i1:119-715(+)